MDTDNKLPSERKKRSSAEEAIQAIMSGAFPPLIQNILRSEGWSNERAETIVRWGKRSKVAASLKLLG